MFSEKELNLQESELRALVRSMTPQQRQRFHDLEMQRLKWPRRYLQLNWLFPFGAHHFYLQRWVRGSINLLFSLTGIYLLAGGVSVAYGLLLVAAVTLIEIPQLLNARHLVHNRNNQIMETCLIEARDRSTP